MSPHNNSGFCNELGDLLSAPATYGRSGREFKSLGLSTVNNLAVLQAMMREFQPKATLEIGLCHGASCLLFTSCHRELGRLPARQHCALDPFQKSVYDESGLFNVERAGLDGYLDFHGDFSSQVLSSFVTGGRSFDLVYIDGSHLFEDVFVDFYYTARLLSAGGVVAFDDCTDPHVLKVVQFIRSNLTGHFEELDTNRYRPKPMASLVYRAARKLGKLQFTAFRRIGPPNREWNSKFTPF